MDRFLPGLGKEAMNGPCISRPNTFTPTLLPSHNHAHRLQLTPPPPPANMMRKFFLLGLAMLALVSASAAPTEQMTQRVSLDLGHRGGGPILPRCVHINTGEARFRLMHCRGQSRQRHRALAYQDAVVITRAHTYTYASMSSSSTTPTCGCIVAS